MQRYQVMWKHDGQVEDLRVVSGRHHFKWRAFKEMHTLNMIGFYSKSKWVAVVWDHKLNRQISKGLYKDRS